LANFLLVIERVVPRVTARQSTAVDNPYLSFVIPASMESTILRHAIFALTASQAAPISTNPNLDSSKALWHKHNVIHLLRKSLVDCGPPNSASLVACYVMLMFEVSI
jgi:Fungal specific transcription factor domain